MPRSSRATSKSRGLTVQQVRDLLAQTPPPTPDPEVSGLVDSDSYRLADGSALLVDASGRGRLHESRDALLAMLGEVTALKPESPFAALLPQAQDFAAQAPALAAQLGLPIPDTPASLPDLDATVRRLTIAACRKPPLFGQLVAYVGETIIATRGGSWQMRQGSDGATWEPWVVDATGRAHAPFGLVYKELAEWGAGSSLTGVLAATLTPLRG